MRYAMIVALVGCGQSYVFSGSNPVPTTDSTDSDLALSDLASTTTDDLSQSSPIDLARAPGDLASVVPSDMSTIGSDMACSTWGNACTMTAQCCLTWSGLPMDATNVQTYCDTTRGECVGLYQIRDGCFGTQTRKCTVDATGNVCTGCTN